MEKKRIKAFTGVIVGGALLSLILQGFFSLILGASIDPKTQKASVADSTPAPDPFANIAIEARAAYVFDIAQNKVLFAKNENEKLPLASVTKLMTAFVARDKMNESTVVTLTKDDLAAEGDIGLRPGERWRLGDLLDVMLLISSNDAAHAVAGFVGSAGQPNDDEANARVRFVGMMNEKARTLGLTTLEFFNESGLDIIDMNKSGLPAIAGRATAGGYGSAHDVALLATELWKKYPSTLEITARKDTRITSQSGIAHILPNTDEALGHFPGALASKTGYTDLAGGNLVILFDVGIGHPVAAVVLGSSYKGRFDDMEKLTKATLEVSE